MSKQDSNNTVIVVIVVFIIVMIIGSFSSNKPAAPPTTSPVDHGAEYNYAKEKFRQSGQPERDASTAAEAVMKFQRAQDARRNK